MKRWKSIAAGWLMTAGLVMALAGCGSSAETAVQYSNSAGTEMKIADSEVLFAQENAAEYEEADAEATSGADADKPEILSSERKLIKTVEMNVETQSFDELLKTVQKQTAELGGYIESMNTYNGSTYSGYRGNRDANLTIRIPKEKLEEFLNTVSGVSNVVTRNERVEDITLTYVDMESHRDALRTEQTRLLELLEQAENVEDIITIEQRLSEVRYQLESMEAQLRTYDNQVDYSTVYLYIGEVEVLTPVEKESVGERIAAGFAESLDNIGEGFVEFGIWFVVHIPYFAVCAILLTLFISLLLWLIKHSVRQPKQSQKQEQTTKKEQE